MAVTFKALAEGYLPAGKGTLYTVPASSTDVVTDITLLNKGTNTRAVKLYVKRLGASSIEILWINAMEPKWQAEGGAGIVLETGDIIEGDGVGANEIAYTVSGARIT